MKAAYLEREADIVNKVLLLGRVCRDPDIRYTQGNEPMAIARYTLAVDRKTKRENEASADFISCVAFGKTAEFAERYLKQGTKIVIEGRIQTGSYTNKDGKKVYTTDVVVESTEFAESKGSGETKEGSSSDMGPAPDGFMSIPEGEEGGLPFE